jgi:hypothetical protein
MVFGLLVWLLFTGGTTTFGAGVSGVGLWVAGNLALLDPL